MDEVGNTRDMVQFIKDDACLHDRYPAHEKYGEYSELNMFDEYSMTNQMTLAEFIGFIKQEFKILCE